MTTMTGEQRGTDVALVRRPGPRLADGIVSHQQPVPVDPASAERQWQSYVDTMSAHGWNVVEVDPADDCPDAVFIEDAVVMFDDLAVITCPGAASRRPEVAGAEAAVAALGVEIARVSPPASFDGGDVLKVGRTAYVGLSNRTNREAVEQLQVLLAPRGWTVVGVPTTRVLHLKSAVTALPDGTVIGYPELVDDPAVYPSFLAVPEPAGSHVVLLNDTDLLMSSDAPLSADLFRSLGYRPVLVDISEFEKLDGCVTCLSVRVRR